MGQLEGQRELNNKQDKHVTEEMSIKKMNLPFNLSMYAIMSSFNTLPSLPVAGTSDKLI